MDQRPTASVLEPPTAVIVDDDARFVRHITTFIQRYCGISVVEAASAAEAAFGPVEARHPSFVLLDICMSGMSGLDAIPILKALSPESHIIVVSGMDGEYRALAVKMGATGYVEKLRILEDLPALLA